MRGEGRGKRAPVYWIIRMGSLESQMFHAAPLVDDVAQAFHPDAHVAFGVADGHLAVAGAGLGLFVISPLSEFLIKKYGWMDAWMIIGAISSHTFVSACTYRLVLILD